MQIPRLRGRAWAVAVVASLATAAPSYAAAPTMKAPVPAAPAAGVAVEALGAFSWSAISGVDRYDFQVAADAGFNSPVLVAGRETLQTKNTSATVTTRLPNGTYYWRVRGVTAAGKVSRWSAPRAFRMAWTAQPIPQTPAYGEQIAYPTTPLMLRWSLVPGAVKYAVTIATDPALGSALGGKAVETQATAYSPLVALTPGAYYWSVTPIDADGNRGTPSGTSLFHWTWDSRTTPTVANLADPATAPGVRDPQFSWVPVKGAARYQVEINSTEQFAPGSKVCCDDPVLGTSLSPQKLYANNVYYWRVRALDLDGNSGAWQPGTPFDKTFNALAADQIIPGLRMRDNVSDPGTDLGGDPTDGYQTEAPVVEWEPVPGASGYQVEVTQYVDLAQACDWSWSLRWNDATATTAWTPLASASALNAPVPYASIGTESNQLADGTKYCVRVQARSDRSNTGADIVSQTRVLRGLGDTDWAFEYQAPTVGPPAPGPSFNIADGQFRLPAQTTVASMPLFTWDRVPGANCYWVVVAKDQQMTTIADVAATRVPAYAPRGGSTAVTYPDETTQYWWTAVPAEGAGCTLTHVTSAQFVTHYFTKRSAPPTRIAPSEGGEVTGQPTFRWSLAQGARYYTLQVATDPSFGNLLQTVTTSSTGYTSNETYPADATLYWRVRANDEKGVGLTWSETGSFVRRLPAPALWADNPVFGETIPVWGWAPVPGAVSYDFQNVDQNGSLRDFPGLRGTAAAYIEFTGTGRSTWRVRANFPKSSGTVAGPWTPFQSFTRVIGEPTGVAQTIAPNRVAFSWSAGKGTKKYRVQVSADESFGSTVEDTTVETTAYSPTLTQGGYVDGGKLWWRVASLDPKDNLGGWTQAQSFSLPKRVQLSAQGFVRRGKASTVKVVALDAKRRPIRGLKVRLSGAGLKARTVKTGKSGVVVLKVKVARKGTLTFAVGQPGFKPGKTTLKIY